MVIIKMTNRIRVKMKERQLDICKNYIKNTTRTALNAEYYDHAEYMVNVLPGDIERFRGLAELDKIIPNERIVRFGGTGETLNDIAHKYMESYKLTPNKPMLKEMAMMYQELLQEEINNIK